MWDSVLFLCYVKQVGDKLFFHSKKCFRYLPVSHNTYPPFLPTTLCPREGMVLVVWEEWVGGVEVRFPVFFFSSSPQPLGWRVILIYGLATSVPLYSYVM